MKQLFILANLLLLVACKGQTDLERLELGKPFPPEKLETYEKDVEVYFDLPVYATETLGDYKFGAVPFSTYRFPNGLPYAYNGVEFVIDDAGNCLGYIIYNFNNAEGEKLLNYLNKKYGKPEERETGFVDTVIYFWDDLAGGKWLFFRQALKKYDDGRENLETKLTVIKKGTRVKNSSDPADLTVLEEFSRSNPKL